MTDFYGMNPHYEDWRAAVVAGETALSLDGWINQPDGPDDEPRFVLDVDTVRRRYTAMAEDDRPTLWAESPGRSLDCLFMDNQRCISDGGAITIFPMIYDNEPDGILVAIYSADTNTGICGYVNDWDEIAPDDSYDRTLTIDEIVSTLQAILHEANSIITRASR